MTKNLPLPSFQVYQRAFTQHLRDATLPTPSGIIKKRMAVYQEIVFNNLFQAVSACYPVAQKVVGKRKWQTLIKEFFKNHAANSPFFKDIPAEFLAFLTKNEPENGLNLPEYFLSLCHYEWVELALTAQENDDLLNVSKKTNPADFLDFTPIFISEMFLLNYDYAVHQISERNKPKAKQPTYLLVYRNTEFNVKFVVLNQTTFTLLSLLKNETLTGQAALLEIAQQLQHPNPDEIINFGVNFLNDFYQQGIIIGFNKNQQRINQN